MRLRLAKVFDHALSNGTGLDRNFFRELKEFPYLKFFEKRLTEVIDYMGPTCTRWRMAIVVIAVIIGLTGSKWLTNSDVDKMSIRHFMLYAHLDFTICTVAAFFLFGVCGVHRRVVAPTIIAKRCRDALSPFSLSCDHNGKLIVKPAMRNSAP